MYLPDTCVVLQAGDNKACITAQTLQSLSLQPSPLWLLLVIPVEVDRITTRLAVSVDLFLTEVCEVQLVDIQCISGVYIVATNLSNTLNAAVTTDLIGTAHQMNTISRYSGFPYFNQSEELPDI